MPNEPNSSPAAQTEHGDAESMGQAILGLLNTAADNAEAHAHRALDAAQQLSGQLSAAQTRIAELEAEVRLSRNG